ncbi:MAG: hypothetical protein QOF41_954 [Methylobacteriaceae bacterium]|nr:hypothetical protein [Methylobacteriaceae bacterium]
MPLAGYILPALPNGDQRWREQQRSVDRPRRNRRERRVRVRVRVRAPTRERVRRNPQRSGRALARVLRRRVHARALVRAQRRRVHARAPVRALAKAHAKAQLARAQLARAVEEAGAAAVAALNPRPARTARSSHSAVELNGPAVESISTPAQSLKRPRRPSSHEGRLSYRPFPLLGLFVRSSSPGQALRREVPPRKLFRFAGSFHLLPLSPTLAHARPRSGGQGGKGGLRERRR